MKSEGEQGWTVREDLKDAINDEMRRNHGKEYCIEYLRQDGEDFEFGYGHYDNSITWQPICMCNKKTQDCISRVIRYDEKYGTKESQNEN